MTHRLRHATQTASFNAPLDGDVEVDETYVGGKSINRHASKRGVGVPKPAKAAIVGAVQRDGEVRAEHVPSPSRANLHRVVRQNVSTDARLITDANNSYQGLSEDYDHHVVNHQHGEYVIAGNIHTNSIESVWALFKRQINGTHHWVSKKHLQAYINEMTWRHNRRDQEEGQRVNNMLRDSAGRLTYEELTA